MADLGLLAAIGTGLERGLNAFDAAKERAIKQREMAEEKAYKRKADELARQDKLFDDESKAIQLYSQENIAHTPAGRGLLSAHLERLRQRREMTGLMEPKPVPVDGAPQGAEARPVGMLDAGPTAAASGLLADPKGFEFDPGYESKAEKAARISMEKMMAANTLAEERKIKGEERAEARARQKEIDMPSSARAQAAAFATRLQDAENIFSELEAAGFSRTDPSAGIQSALSNAPFGVGSIARGAGMIDKNVIRQEQAERNFVNSVLRRESGAAISKGEFQNAEKQYFPRAGDPPEVLEQKRENRMAALAALKAEAGSGLLKKVGGIKKDTMRSSFPKTVRRGNETATVSNEAELKEANAEGFR